MNHTLVHPYDLNHGMECSNVQHVSFTYHNAKSPLCRGAGTYLPNVSHILEHPNPKFSLLSRPEPITPGVRVRHIYDMFVGS